MKTPKGGFRTNQFLLQNSTQSKKEKKEEFPYSLTFTPHFFLGLGFRVKVQYSFQQGSNQYCCTPPPNAIFFLSITIQTFSGSL
jgi:hypothetical protein